MKKPTKSQELEHSAQDVDQQLTRDQLDRLTAPAYNLTIMFDPRVGKFIVHAMKSTGEPMDFITGHQMLDGARAELIKAETEQRVRAANTPSASGPNEKTP